MDEQHAAVPRAHCVREKAIDRGPRFVRGEAVQVEVGLPGEIAAPETTQQARIEADDGPFYVLTGVADVEPGAAVHELRERRERLSLLADGGPRPASRPGRVDTGTRAAQRDDAFHGARKRVRLIDRNALRRHPRRGNRGHAHPLPEVGEGSVQSLRPATALSWSRRRAGRAMRTL